VEHGTRLRRAGTAQRGVPRHRGEAPGAVIAGTIPDRPMERLSGVGTPGDLGEPLTRALSRCRHRGRPARDGRSSRTFTVGTCEQHREAFMKRVGRNSVRS
jgi:hypothetical protein